MNYVYNLIEDNTCILAFMSDEKLTLAEITAKYQRAYGTGSANYSVMTFVYIDDKPTLIKWED